jgi:hypothetical protein
LKSISSFQVTNEDVQFLKELLLQEFLVHLSFFHIQHLRLQINQYWILMTSMLRSRNFLVCLLNFT